MKKLRKPAKELLQSASKIYHYRRDVISEARLHDLDKAVNEVQSQLKAEDSLKLKAAMERLDALLKKIGGKMYPKTFLNDNIEVALVAAIIVIGIRTFFFQPFIIPTNSMYPTYSGMNAEVYEKGEGEPGALNKLFRLATLGARHKAVVAKNSGPIELPVAVAPDGRLQFYVEPVKGRKFLVVPTTRAKFFIFVDGEPHHVVVPMEFASEMNTVIRDAFNIDGHELLRQPGNNKYAIMRLQQRAEAGEDLLRFDITLGDALFVDRLTYHFRKPKAGEPFVFRTDDIQQEIGKHSGDYTNKYYIKRLAGVAGETLEIRDGTLLVDGQPRGEVEAFGRNARREGEYQGYINQDLLAEGREMKIPEGKFVALGDNSGNSLDSRYWGFVPEKAVIGKAFFIYFPFTKRWGVAE
ncbi:signal peptidase I [Coraliomargarita sinensis]|uniref:Signal peptidase I n=1 Tax=Coraliomargarita sinensis TaxID=2174842 RepID=A0A317ZF83_9BACT|nr:signal peptidase I [Coraliomargarita sinensis]PXA04185.1 signal peptidase I [Coraliomargarita sinensis]